MNPLEPLVELAKSVYNEKGRPIIFMEVCGTHTVSISKMGIRRMLSPYVELRSGPGCPVCVTDQRDIEYFLEMAAHYNLTVCTFGDMLRVPGRRGSLEEKRAEGLKVKIFYSSFDALSYATERKDEEILFLGVGFETTAPTIAFTILEAERKGVRNFSVFSLHKLIPPAVDVIASDRDLKIDGFILPGHVSTIAGRASFDFISKKYNIPSVVTGFEEGDIIKGIYMLLRQLKEKRWVTENAYERLVKDEGNVKAKGIMYEVFEASTATWRGLGSIPQSGLKIKEKYGVFDAAKRYPLDFKSDYAEENGVCRCGDVLRGRIEPKDCPLFSAVCNPINPFGPCMVSSEGACSAYFHYGDKDG